MTANYEPGTEAMKLRDRLAADRALRAIKRADEKLRKHEQMQHRIELANILESSKVDKRTRRQRERDDVQGEKLADLYRRATRDGARARIRADIHRTAEWRAQQRDRVRNVATIALLPVLLAFAAWSTAGVQAGMVKFGGIADSSPLWWAAWLVEPALITIVAGIIVFRTMLRAIGGEVDWRATAVEWVALSASLALNFFGSLNGWEWNSIRSAIAHSFGPLGAAGTAFLIGLIGDYTNRVDVSRGATRIADLDLSGHPQIPGRATEVEPLARKVLEPAEPGAEPPALKAPSHPRGYPWATPPEPPRATSEPPPQAGSEPPPEPPVKPAPEPPPSHPAEPVAHPAVAHGETAGQEPSHHAEPPDRATLPEPVDQGGSEDQPEVAHDEPEPVAQVAQSRAEPLPPNAPEPGGSGQPEAIDDAVARAIRAIDSSELSERRAADKFDVSRGSIQRRRKAIAEGKVALPDQPDDEVKREVAGLDDALERILARGGSED